MFRNVLIADSGKGHVEEMVRMLRDIPTVRQARFNLLHVVPEQVGESFTEHSQKAAGIAAEAVLRLGLDPGGGEHNHPPGRHQANGAQGGR